MSPIAIAVIAGVVVLLISVFFDRVLVPWQARRSVQKVLKTGVKHDPRALEDPKYGRGVGDGDCLRISDDNGNSAELRWAEVEEVHAYKRDLLTTDLICLAFKRAGKDEYSEIHEEMAGYHDLIEILPGHLAGFTLGWILSVAVPAFKTNHQVIWKRSPNNAVRATAAKPGS